ncbi:MAG: signal recognition particle protein [Oscillospiraceae bacterium]|nr:signal recognition particle protein [Oscillospiraceae bacterium]
MAFEGLTEKISATFKKLRGKGRLKESDVKEAMREIRLALLEADVSYKVVKDFVKSTTERCVGADVLESLTPAQMIVKIVNEEMCKLMGSDIKHITINPNGPTVVMLVGLQGAGKTTNGSKLAGLMKRQGKNPLLVACDIYRPAAIQQLKVCGEKLGIPVFEKGTQNPVNTAKEAVLYARQHGHDMVFLDTAGRLHIDEALMEELKNIKSTVKPYEIMLVVDAMTGQDAVNAAQSFNDWLDIDSVMLSKLDGDARGGAALSVRAITGKPIKFAGMGEKLEDIEPFHPDRIASRILGMGDVLSLIEKAEKAYGAKKAAEMEEKLRTNRFTLQDFYDQMVQLKSMGSMQDILAQMPGMGGNMKNLQVDEKQLARTEAIILSMTPKERENPDIIGASRKKRIAAGSGVKVEDVNRLLKSFEQMRKLVKQFSGPGMGKKMKRMRGMGGFGGFGGGFPGF